ncbi:MAG: tol-pal system protein YbgF [Methylococcales bacterium]|nr:tol-pal system protein YbgF [Methylococcales bacterium]
MNKILFLVLLTVYSAVYAESRALAPVIDNSTYLSGSVSGASAPSANAMYEVLGRLEQLQGEIQQLRGVVEEQAHMILDLKKRQNNIYSDLDLRLQELVGVDVSQMPNKEANGNNLDKVQSLGKTSIPVRSKSKVVAVNPRSSARNEKELYQAAYKTLRNGHNTRAISEFKTLLIEFPNGEYADNAQYWLGEAYKVNRDLSSAKQAFSKLVNEYSHSPKVADALLKLGYIEFEQNNMAKARDYLTRVTINYPGTTPAHLAKKRLRKMGVNP